jgi:hypothetical protein
MSQIIIKKQANDNIFVKYKKWIIAGLGVYIVPTLILAVSFITYVTYGYFNSDIRSHPYQQYIYGGYNIGVQDGDKDRKVNNHPDNTKEYFKSREYLDDIPWLTYKEETEILQKAAIAEKDQYLAQFTGSERGEKLAEMRLNDIKLPVQKKLEERFSNVATFYMDYIENKIKRKDYKSDDEYNQALSKEAWRLGYEYGYAKGRAFGEFLAKDIR